MARDWNELGRYGGGGIDLVIAMLLLGAAGRWLDARYWPGHDWGMLCGGVLGVAVGVRSLVRAAQRMQRDIEAAEARDPAAHRWTVDPGWLHDPDKTTTTPDEPDEPPHGRPPGDGG
jgi:hypothetical protein